MMHKVNIKIIGEEACEVTIKNEDATLSNPLKLFTVEDPRVDFVAYKPEHLMKKNTIFFIKSKTGILPMIDASKKIASIYEQMLQQAAAFA